jgi:DNA-binding NarL/FixJ family response regulator
VGQRKTVEVHLGRAYGKLRIRSRAELPDALGAGDGSGR